MRFSIFKWNKTNYLHFKNAKFLFFESCMDTRLERFVVCCLHCYCITSFSFWFCRKKIHLKPHLSTVKYFLCSCQFPAGFWQMKSTFACGEMTSLVFLEVQMLYKVHGCAYVCAFLCWCDRRGDRESVTQQRLQVGTTNKRQERKYHILQWMEGWQVMSRWADRVRSNHSERRMHTDPASDRKEKVIDKIKQVPWKKRCQTLTLSGRTAEQWILKDNVSRRLTVWRLLH